MAYKRASGSVLISGHLHTVHIKVGAFYPVVVRSQPDEAPACPLVLQDEIDAIYDKINSILDAEFEASKAYVPKEKDWLSSHWWVCGGERGPPIGLLLG